MLKLVLSEPNHSLNGQSFEIRVCEADQDAVVATLVCGDQEACETNLESLKTLIEYLTESVPAVETRRQN